MCTCFGWTWEYVDDNMTLERLNAMELYWKENPPLHILVANYMGYEKPKNAKDKEKEAEENCAALFAALSSGRTDGSIFKEE